MQEHDTIELRLARLERGMRRWRVLGLVATTALLVFFCSAAGNATSKPQDVTVGTLHAQSIYVGSANSGGGVSISANEESATLSMMARARGKDGKPTWGGVCSIIVSDDTAGMSLMTASDTLPADGQNLSKMIDHQEGWVLMANRQETYARGTRDNQAAFAFSSQPKGGQNFLVTDANGRTALHAP